jgi:hypothetical protein
MAKAIVFEVFLLAGLVFRACQPPQCMWNASHTRTEIIRSSRLLALRFVLDHPPPLAQQVAVPVFPPTDAPIARLYCPDEPFQVIGRARKHQQVIAVDQLLPQAVGHSQEMFQTAALGRTQLVCTKEPAQPLTPAVEVLANRCIRDRELERAQRLSRQDALGLQQACVPPPQAVQIGPPALSARHPALGAAPAWQRWRWSGRPLLQPCQAGATLTQRVIQRQAGVAKRLWSFQIHASLDRQSLVIQHLELRGCAGTLTTIGLPFGDLAQQLPAQIAKRLLDGFANRFAQRAVELRDRPAGLTEVVELADRMRNGWPSEATAGRMDSWASLTAKAPAT